MIRFENVSKRFDSGGRQIAAVENVNLNIQKGKIFGIIGFSGAGKSTLVRCINLLESPTEGKVYVDGVELTGLSEDKLREHRKKIGMIFQQFNLFKSRTVYENVAFPLRRSKLGKAEKEEKIEGLLKLVGLEEYKKSYPSQLSGGQKQRVAIARALANDPQVLLSDESTSALDPQTTKSILKLLKKVNEEMGITIVMITHEMQVVKEICDEVAVMEKGQVVEKGSVFEVFASPKQEITKAFVDSTSNLSRIYELVEEGSPMTALKEGQCILRLRYLKQDVSEALVSHISRKYELDINIIFGNIELIHENPIGGLVAIVSGERKNIQEAIELLKEKNIGVEVILDAGTVRKNNTQCA
ncbi:MAG: ATP-binding cassette domain-containing protein [Lachnospiraceae bacterium]|nr:ATP-binding cassette domain-containing protein [Lachnospiraceae bacterium]NCD01777.1 ATP-binding cassette domain-containing protein [Clostridia bacterium]